MSHCKMCGHNISQRDHAPSCNQMSGAGDDHWSEAREMIRRQVSGHWATPSNAAELRARYALDPEERAAKYRLGEWLAAKPGRAWEERGGKVILFTDFDSLEPGPVQASWASDGTGPTLAAAINDALDKVT